MDGTQLNLFVPNIGKIKNNCGGMDIDRVSKRLYWIHCEKQMIESIDYEGKNKLFVAKVQNPIAVAIYSNYLFWSMNTTGEFEICLNLF